MTSILISDIERLDSRLSAETLVRAGAEQHARREFVLTFDPPPIPGWERYAWHVTDSNTYDGAPDAPERNQVGRGPTADAALCDLLDMLEDETENA